MRIIKVFVVNVRIFWRKSPNSIQFMVKDYDQDTYSDDNLQFILRYSGASSLRMQIAGKTPIRCYILSFNIDK